jgi:hypothetical protein
MAEKASVTSLFGGLLSPNEMRQFTRAQDIELGKTMAQPGVETGLLFAPQAVTAAGRLGRRLVGQDPRTQQEIQMAENKALFTEITQEAQKQFPNDRTAQLNYLADQLTAKGKVVEAQKARALAQQSQASQADIQKTIAEKEKAEAQAAKALAEETETKEKTTGLRNSLENFLGIDLKDATTTSMAEAAKIRNAGRLGPETEQGFKARIMDALKDKEDKGVTVTVDQREQSAFAKKMGEENAKWYGEARQSIDNAQRAMTTVQRGLTMLEQEEVNLGAASTMRQFADKVGALFGFEESEERAAATETYLANQAKLVQEALASGAFGAGTAISDKDREAMEKAVAANGSLTVEGAKRILNLVGQMRAQEFQDYNQRVEEINSRNPEANLPKKYYEGQQLVKDGVTYVVRGGMAYPLPASGEQ